MAMAKDERDRILLLIEAGQITASQASQLLDTFEAEQGVSRERLVERTRGRIIRIRATSMKSRVQRINILGTLPLDLLKIGLRFGVQLVPQLSNSTVEDILRSINEGAMGRILDLQDLENGERLEIFVE